MGVLGQGEYREREDDLEYTQHFGWRLESFSDTRKEELVKERKV